MSAWEKQYDELNYIPEGMEDFYRGKPLVYKDAELTTIRAENDIVNEVASSIADTVVPSYRSGQRTYGCGSWTARMWDAAYTASLIALAKEALK